MEGDTMILFKMALLVWLFYINLEKRKESALDVFKDDCYCVVFIGSNQMF